MELDQYLNMAKSLSEQLKVVGPVSSLGLYVMCIEIMYNLTHNDSFNRIFMALKNTFSDIPYLVIILFGLLSCFALEIHFTLGFYFEEFSSLFNSYITLLDSLYSFKNMNFIMN